MIVKLDELLERAASLQSTEEAAALASLIIKMIKKEKKEQEKAEQKKQEASQGQFSQNQDSSPVEQSAVEWLDQVLHPIKEDLRGDASVFRKACGLSSATSYGDRRYPRICPSSA
jgi:hypothetical protein